MCTIFNAIGRTKEARENFAKAVEQLRVEVAENPYSHSVYARLGSALAMTGNFKSASEAFRQALALNPGEFSYYRNLASILQSQNKLDEAIKVLEDGVKFMSDNGKMEAAARLKQQLGLLEY